jgi:hypothetical protein
MTGVQNSRLAVVARVTAATALAAIALQASAQNAVMTQDGHTFSYQERIQTAPGDLQGEVVGTIVITREDGQEIVYEEETALRPGCGDEPAVEYLGGDFVALCGHLGGRHYTKTVFRLTPEPAPLAQLDFFDAPAPVGIDRNGILRTRVLRRDVFRGVTGPVYFPYVHSLDATAAQPVFAADFSASARPIYLDYYETLRREGQPAEHYREMAAALVAAGDVRFACRELGELKRALPASVDLRQWLRTLPQGGYPVFDVRGCKGI